MYIPNGGTQEQHYSVSFLPTGELDMLHTPPGDLLNATLLLAPTIASLQNATGNDRMDIWKVITWVSVTDYWLVLYDLGQISPTLYNSLPDGTVDFSDPITFPSTNNIFINESLFEIFSETLNDTILPLIRLALPNTTLPESMPLTDHNQLEPYDATFYRSYTCSERRLKGWFSVMISVLAADYALIGGAYNLSIFILGWWQKRKHTGTSLMKQF